MMENMMNEQAETETIIDDAPNEDALILEAIQKHAGGQPTEDTKPTATTDQVEAKDQSEALEPEGTSEEEEQPKSQRSARSIAEDHKREVKFRREQAELKRERELFDRAKKGDREALREIDWDYDSVAQGLSGFEPAEPKVEDYVKQLTDRIAQLEARESKKEQEHSKTTFHGNIEQHITTHAGVYPFMEAAERDYVYEQVALTIQEIHEKTGRNDAGLYKDAFARVDKEIRSAAERFLPLLSKISTTPTSKPQSKTLTNVSSTARKAVQDHLQVDDDALLEAAIRKHTLAR